jgi:N-acetylmuramoyl-L-alanine amidase
VENFFARRGSTIQGLGGSMQMDQQGGARHRPEPQDYWSRGVSSPPKQQPQSGAREQAEPQSLSPSSNEVRSLARAIMAENAGIPEDHAAIGWSIKNRVGDKRYGMTVDEVIRQPRQYDIMRGRGTPLWRATEGPDPFTAPNDKANLESWTKAQEAADGILRGLIPDPTGGATHFFSSSQYTGDPQTAPQGWYRNALDAENIGPSSYQSRSTGRTKNYFFIAP